MDSNKIKSYQYFNTVATLFKFNVRVTEFIIEIFRAIDSEESGLPPDTLTLSIILKAFIFKYGKGGVFDWN